MSNYTANVVLFKNAGVLIQGYRKYGLYGIYRKGNRKS